MVIHLGRNKMDYIVQTTFWNKLSSIKIAWFKFNWSLFLEIRLTVSHHFCRTWHYAEQATYHYLNQWWPESGTLIYASPALIGQLRWAEKKKCFVIISLKRVSLARAFCLEIENEEHCVTNCQINDTECQMLFTKISSKFPTFAQLNHHENLYISRQTDTDMAWKVLIHTNNLISATQKSMGHVFLPNSNILLVSLMVYKELVLSIIMSNAGRALHSDYIYVFISANTWRAYYKNI